MWMSERPTHTWPARFGKTCRRSRHALPSRGFAPKHGIPAHRTRASGFGRPSLPLEARLRTRTTSLGNRAATGSRTAGSPSGKKFGRTTQSRTERKGLRMVHLYSALRLAQPDMFTQRTASRRSAATASTDSAASLSTAPSTTGASADTAVNGFRALFSGKLTPVAPATPAPTLPPTADSVFGANPWITNSGGAGPNGVTYSYNPLYFATPATAAKVAQMVGGKVVPMNALTGDGGPYIQNHPNQMVQLPNGRMLNAGMIASIYTHGYPQSYINILVSNEING